MGGSSRPRLDGDYSPPPVLRPFRDRILGEGIPAGQADALTRALARILHDPSARIATRERIRHAALTFEEANAITDAWAARQASFTLFGMATRWETVLTTGEHQMIRHLRERFTELAAGCDETAGL